MFKARELFGKLNVEIPAGATSYTTTGIREGFGVIFKTPDGEVAIALTEHQYFSLLQQQLAGRSNHQFLLDPLH